MVPDRFRSSFSPATLKVIETQSAKLQLREPLFFRGAHTANVVENERRSFSPIVVVESGGIAKARCTCIGWMKLGDLCRHLAVLVARSADGEGVLPSERFETSVWRAIAFASFNDGREIVADEYADPREQVLRKYVLTPTEQELLRRGSGSSRLQFEGSRWYRWAVDMFERGADAKLELRDGVFHMNGVALPASAVESLVTSGVAARNGFEVVHDALTPSLRIAVEEGTLRFTPVLLWSAATPVAALQRDSLPRFGRFFLIGNRFASAKTVLPMFIDRSTREQAMLFETRSSAGLPYDSETVIPPDEVFAFVEKHREELAAMPPELAPECVRDAKPVRLDDEVVFDFALAEHRDLLEVDIVFSHGVRASDIAKARREHVRALIRGNVWIDVADPQFDWTQHATFGKSGRVLVTKLELLRIRGSLRGKAVFRGDPACEAVFRMFDEHQIAADAPPPASLGIDLYGYQQTGYLWLWLLQQNGFGGLLCDDMGLGKTHQAMALIAAIAQVNPGASILVVCPTSLIDHWRDKLRRYLPGTPVTLTSYGIVRSRIEQFRGRRFDLLVLDEMQTIKNSDTTTHQALRAIEKTIAVGLTGTPIENHERELMALLDFVVPGYLPKHVEDRATLQRLVRPFVLRRTKAQVLTDLPPKIVDKRYCELTAEQRALYRNVLDSRAKPLRMQLKSGAHVSYVHVFAALNFLKQICNHPASAGGGFAVDSVPGAKWELFTDLVAECMSSGLKVVVFSQYVKMLELIERHLGEQSIAFASIKGATRDRGREIARFRDDPDCRVFTASLRAGGLGIDLTSASVVIHYDRWWNQAREDQATDRVHRLGQSRGVQVIKLITRGTVEEKIDALIARKAAIATELIQDDDPSLVKQFTVDELDELLSE
jgi:superfamily II DNA or RNA helicase